MLCLSQIGPVDLAAMNLSNAILFATLVLPIGFTNAVRVLAAQSYGAGQAKNVGLWVQVGLALSAILFLIPISLIWIFAGDIVCSMNLQAEELDFLEQPDGMVDLGIATASALFDNVTTVAEATSMSMPMSHSEMMVEQELCQKAATFGRVSLLWLWPLVIYNVMTCVLEALEIVWPATIMTLLFVGVNFGLNYIFLTWLQLGLVGSALATSVSKILQLLLLMTLMIKYYKLHTQLWSPWSRECLRWHRVKPFLKLGLPMMATEAMYDWVFEISILISGSFGIAEAGATGVLINLVFFFTPLLTGIYVAVAVRVSTLLGERDVEGAKRAVWISVQAALGVSLFGGGLMVALRQYIPHIYTSDDEVIFIVTDFTPLAAVDFILSSFAFVMQGVLEGQSRPQWATASSIAGTWMIGLPVSALLALQFDMEMTGLWIGMLVGEGCKLILMMIAIMRTNWRAQCDVAIKAAADEDAMLNEAAGITTYGATNSPVLVEDDEADDASVEYRR
jgi:putative MATE family efflux protein